MMVLEYSVKTYIYSDSDYNEEGIFEYTVEEYYHTGWWYNTGDTGSLSINLLAISDLKGSPGPFPEPTTMLLLSSGLIGLVGIRRNFKKD
jgi:hypothetical protein